MKLFGHETDGGWRSEADDGQGAKEHLNRHPVNTIKNSI